VGILSPPTFLEQLQHVAQVVTPVQIPAELQRPEYRFCIAGWPAGKLAAKARTCTTEADADSTLKGMKMPRGKSWQEPGLTWDDAQLQRWIKAGGNYGTIAGSTWQVDGHGARLVLLDLDNPPALVQAGLGFDADLPNTTLKVKTGRADPPGQHVYLLSDIDSTKAHYEIPGICHFKFYASQCIGPGSLHPSGRRYELVDHSTPTWVDGEVLTSVILDIIRAFQPDKVNDAKSWLNVAPSHGTSPDPQKKKAEQAARLEEIKKDQLKKKQQREAQSEIAYIALQSRIANGGDVQALDHDLAGKSGHLERLFQRITHDDRLNPCLCRLTASLPACRRFEAAIGGPQGKPGEGEHALRLAWATALVKAGYTDDEIHMLAQHFDDYTESRTQQQLASIRSYVDDGGDYHPCKTLTAYIPADWCRGCRWTPPKDSDGKVIAQADITLSPVGSDPDVDARARQIIDAGEVPEFWVKVYHRRHHGDDDIPISMLAANLTANIDNANGIAVLQVSGESGDGKSHAVATTAQQMGHWCDFSGLSPMALLYHAGETVHAGMMIVMDDNRPNDQQADIIKRAQTQFKTGYKYKTVIKGKPVELQMPPGVQILTTEVDAEAEDQQLNRTVLHEAIGSLTKDQQIIDSTLNRLESGDLPESDPDIMVCRAALDQLKSMRYVVTIPDAKKRIRWKERSKDRANLRNFNIFIDWILAFAVMRWPLRPHRVAPDGVMHLEANRDDFMSALALYGVVNRAMKTKLTQKEQDLLKAVREAGGRLARKDAMIKLGISKGRLSHLIHGKNGQSGLLAKVPGFYVEDTTETEAVPETYSTRLVRKKYLRLVGIGDAQTLVTDGAGLVAEWIEG